MVSCDGIVVGAGWEGTLVEGKGLAWAVPRRVASGEEPAWAVLRGSAMASSMSMESVVSVP